MKMIEALDSLKNALEKVNRILIITHVNPDGDAVGSSVALRGILEVLGKSVEIVMSDEIPSKYQFLVDRPVWDARDPEFAQLASRQLFQMVIFLDSSERERVGAVLDHLAEWIVNDPLYVNIDHHISNDLYGDIVIVDPRRSSSAELVQELARHLDVTINPQTADQLFAGILTDTGRFQYSNANASSLHAAGELVEAGADPARVADQIYFGRSLQFYRLLGFLLETMELHHGGRTCVMLLSSEKSASLWPEGQLDTEGIVDYTIQIENVEVGIFMKEMGEKDYRASLRSRGDFNVQALAEALGGGGHEGAAGCSLAGSLEEVKAEILAEVEKRLS